MKSQLAIVSASERYVIAQGSHYQVRVWQLPEIKKVGSTRKPWRREYYFGVSLASHPTKDRFAASWGGLIHIYDIEPFHKILEIELERSIYSMGFAGDDILVVMTDRNIQIWDITRQELVAATPDAYILTTSSPNAGDSPADLVSPDGRWIAAYRANRSKDEIVLYEIPHRK